MRTNLFGGFKVRPRKANNHSGINQSDLMDVSHVLRSISFTLEDDVQKGCPKQLEFEMNFEHIQALV